jgi:FixJ family two-component response regulator
MLSGRRKLTRGRERFWGPVKEFPEPDVRNALPLVDPSSSLPGTTVYVADQDEAIRQSWTALIQSWGFNVQCFGTGRELLDALSPSPCGCLVLELHLPDTRGLDLWQTLRARGMCLSLVITAAQPAVADVVQAVKAGAVDFLEKPVTPQRLQESIQCALAHSIDEWPRTKRRAEIQGRVNQLSADEQIVMRMLLTSKSMQQIADELELSLRTVHLRRARLLKKMQVATRLELAQVLMTIQGHAVNEPST